MDSMKELYKDLLVDCTVVCGSSNAAGLRSSAVTVAVAAVVALVAAC